MEAKRIVTVIIILACQLPISLVGQNLFLDSRDQQEYQIVEIGELIWFSQNLNYASADSECYESSAYNCEKYGRLYTFYEAEDACPEGWRLPSKKDIKGLRRAMKSKTFESIVDKKDWTTEEADIGTNALGLGIKPGGRKFDKDYIPKDNDGKTFFGIGISASFWMSEENHKSPRHWHVNHFGGSQKMKVHKHGPPPVGAKFSVLCVTDARK